MSSCAVGEPGKSSRSRKGIAGAKIRRKLRGRGPDVYLVQLKGHNQNAVAEAIKHYWGVARAVAYAEPDYLVWAMGTPDDARFSEQWGLLLSVWKGCLFNFPSATLAQRSHSVRR